MIELNLNRFMKVLNEYAEQVKIRYNDKIANEVYKNDWKRNASGELIQSVTTGISVNGMIYSVTFDAIGYWQYIENGTKGNYNKGEFPHNEFKYDSHKPFQDSILRWIQIKPILPREDNNGRLPTEKQLAFLIGRKIRRDGIEGNHPLERTITELNAMYLPMLQEALQADFDESVSKYVTALFPNLV